MMANMTTKNAYMGALSPVCPGHRRKLAAGTVVRGLARHSRGAYSKNGKPGRRFGN
jgi:hypothetical protein